MSKQTIKEDIYRDVNGIYGTLEVEDGVTYFKFLNEYKQADNSRIQANPALITLVKSGCNWFGRGGGREGEQPKKDVTINVHILVYN